jgi:ribosome-associated translation inhibitor RaiA
MKNHDDVATVDASLRLTGGVDPSERAAIVDHWTSLDHRLRSFRSDQVVLQLSIKDRDTAGQHTTLEATIAGFPRLVATSNQADFGRAINEVRDDLIRQLNDAKTRHEPRNNKHLRETTRG